MYSGVPEMEFGSRFGRRVRVGDVAGCPAVHGSHLERLSLPIFRRVLDYAERVYPEVVEPQGPRDFNRVQILSWQLGGWYL